MSEEANDTVVETMPESDGKSVKKNKNKVSKAKQQKVVFRLCDVDDGRYVPHIDDKVAFDKVLDNARVRGRQHNSHKLRDSASQRSSESGWS